MRVFLTSAILLILTSCSTSPSDDESAADQHVDSAQASADGESSYLVAAGPAAAGVNPVNPIVPAPLAGPGPAAIARPMGTMPCAPNMPCGPNGPGQIVPPFAVVPSSNPRPPLPGQLATDTAAGSGYPIAPSDQSRFQQNIRVNYGSAARLRFAVNRELVTSCRLNGIAGSMFYNPTAVVSDNYILQTTVSGLNVQFDIQMPKVKGDIIWMLQCTGYQEAIITFRAAYKLANVYLMVGKPIPQYILNLGLALQGKVYTSNEWAALQQSIAADPEWRGSVCFSAVPVSVLVNQQVFLQTQISTLPGAVPTTQWVNVNFRSVSIGGCNSGKLFIFKEVPSVAGSAQKWGLFRTGETIGSLLGNGSCREILRNVTYGSGSYVDNATGCSIQINYADPQNAQCLVDNLGIISAGLGLIPGFAGVDMMTANGASATDRWLGMLAVAADIASLGTASGATALGRISLGTLWAANSARILIMAQNGMLNTSAGLTSSLIMATQTAVATTVFFTVKLPPGADVSALTKSQLKNGLDDVTLTLEDPAVYATLKAVTGNPNLKRVLNKDDLMQMIDQIAPPPQGAQVASTDKGLAVNLVPNAPATCSLGRLRRLFMPAQACSKPQPPFAGFIGLDETLEENAFSLLVPQPSGKLWWAGRIGRPDAITNSEVAILDPVTGQALKLGGAEFGNFKLNDLPSLTSPACEGIPVGVSQIVYKKFKYAIVPDGVTLTPEQLGVNAVTTPSRWNQFFQSTVWPLISTP